MFNVAFSLLLVALALNAENALGTNQHLICKTVDDVFSDGTLSQASIRPQALQGPSGKRGPTGVKGEHGVPGLNGEQGLPGSKGEGGLQGSKGGRGFPGLVGERGVTGSKGERGLPGSKGERGLLGSKGERGLPGSNGERGLPGTNGERGLPGSNGERGLPGSNGDRGLPGSKGGRGLPGLVDPQDIVNAVEEKMREVTREFQEKIETLEGKVLELNSSIQVEQTSTLIRHDVTTTEPTTGGQTTSGATSATISDSTPPQEHTAKQNEVDQTTTSSDLLLCHEEEGFIYKTKCYYLIRGFMTHPKARELCTTKGGRPADILNAEHQSLVAIYVRKKTTTPINIWLGMSYRTGTLRFFNGNEVTGDVAASIRWWSGFPRSASSWDAMRILVTTLTYGIVNIYPTITSSYVLCEK